MALGDSMTAGFGMRGTALLTGLVEFRGQVCSIGGDDGAVTVPNFLEAVTGRKPFGASKGVTLPLDAIKFRDHIVQPWYPPVAQLNGAQSEAKIWALPDQVSYLLSFMKNNSEKIDIQNDWKLLTILIGANDLCVSCEGRPEEEAAPWIAQYDAILQQIQTSIPRVVVSLVPVFNISQVAVLSNASQYCIEFHKLFNECPCLRQGPAARLSMDTHAVHYNQQLFALEAKWTAKGLDSMAVRIQPITLDLAIPGLDYLSKVDCFHPNWRADELLAVALWNSLLLPPGQKPTNVDPAMKPICPQAGDVFQ